MTVASDAHASTAGNATASGSVGRIPVRNLWLLMLYASDLYRDLGPDRIAVEENPDDIADLVGEMLARQVERRLKRNLSAGFREREAVVSRVRGRIRLLPTERHQLLDRGMVACRFEEVTVDTPRNRYVQAALDRVAGLVRRRDLAHRCRSLAAGLRRMGVARDKPSRAEMSVDLFGRNDAADRQMLTAARLAFDLALPTETAGFEHLSLPDREVTWIRRLYEKGVAGFYDVVLSEEGWRVEAGRTIHWLIEDGTAGIRQVLPSMRTDIVLERPSKGQRIVVDTKFTSVLTQGWHREETLRSGYVYQIYAYLRSQEGKGDPLAAQASGLLLHPSVGVSFNEAAVIQGHEIRFATVDLGAEAKEIRLRLLQVLETGPRGG